jgi:hypothetical protein
VIYLHGNRTFPQHHDVVMLGDDIWAEVSSKPDFLRRKGAADDVRRPDHGKGGPAPRTAPQTANTIT